MIGATTVDLSTVPGLLAALTILSVASAFFLDKRRRDLVSLYKEMYDAKVYEVREIESRHNTEVEELKGRITSLEVRVNFYESEFTTKLAEGITTAIVNMVEEHWGDKGTKLPG